MKKINDFEQFKDIFYNKSEDFLLILDSSALLSLYEYHKSIRKNILEELNSFHKNNNETVWLPYKIYEEFKSNYQKYQNREKREPDIVLENIEKKIEEAQETMETKTEDLQGLGYKISEPSKKLFDEYIEKLRVNIENIIEEEDVDISDEDVDVNNYIENLKKTDRVDHPLKFNELMKIYEEGETRYRLQIPPGYEDQQKNDQLLKKQRDGKIIKGNLTDQFGDLIIWKCILEKAQEEQANVLFVTEDLKPDWWETKNTTISGPRKELLHEFKSRDIGDKYFFMLKGSEFFTYLLENTTSGVSNEDWLRINYRNLASHRLEISAKDKLYKLLSKKLRNDEEVLEYLDMNDFDVENEIDATIQHVERFDYPPDDFRLAFSDDKFFIRMYIYISAEVMFSNLFDQALASIDMTVIVDLFYDLDNLNKSEEEIFGEKKNFTVRKVIVNDVSPPIV